MGHQRTALEAWKREVDDSYDNFEMINIATGRGAGSTSSAGCRVRCICGRTRISSPAR